MNPAATPGATPGESGVVPPRPHQRIMDGPPVVLQAEVDRLHRLIAIVVRA